MQTALVTGAAGQDGHYLTALLREQGFTVHGTAAPGTMEPDDVHTMEWHEVDLADPSAASQLVARVRPDHLYHLAGLSSVAASWADPVGTMQINGTASVALLEASWALHADGHALRFVQASSGEIFGEAEQAPQDEGTPLRPVNPYGASKALAHLAVGVYRARGLHASSLILYNHESPRRSDAFVTRKITSTVAAIARGEATELRLGNLDSRRDWGWAPDYVKAMLLAAQHDEGDDYVIATGIAHSVWDFVAAAFAHVGITDWEQYVVVDPTFFRPTDPSDQRGDASKARELLGWRTSLSFEEMVAAMVEADLT